MFSRLLALTRLVFVLLLLNSAAVLANELALSSAEQELIANLPVIRLGVDADYAPYAFIDEQQRYRGLSADVMTLISQHTGLRFEVVHGLSWPDILSAAQNGKLDLITTAVKRPDREGYLNFTEVYIPTPLVIVTRQERPRLQHPQNLSEGKVALVTGYSSSDEVLEAYPNLEPLWADTPLAGLQAVADGEAEAYVGVLGVSSYLISQHGLSNLKINAGFDMSPNGQRLGVRKDWPELTQLLDRALAHIRENHSQGLLEKWLPVPYEQLGQVSAGISHTQQRWLKQHPTLRVGVLQSLPPYESYSSESLHGGLASAYLIKLSEYTGQQFSLQPAASNQDLLEALRNGSIDLISGWYTPEAPHDMLASDAYLETPLLIIGQRSNPADHAKRDLNHSPLLVRSNSMADLWLQQSPPPATVSRLPDNQRVLDELLNNPQALAIMPAAVAIPLLQQDHYAPLTVTGTLPQNLRMRMLMRDDWQAQQQLINQTLHSLSSDEHNAIRNAWLLPDSDSGLDPWQVLSWTIGIGIGVVLAFTLVMTWNRQLKSRLAQQLNTHEQLLNERANDLERMIHETEQRQSAQQALHDSEYLLRRAQQVARLGNLVWPLDGPTLNLSPMAAELLDWPAEQPIPLQTLTNRFHPDDRRRFELDWQGCRNGMELDGEYRLKLPEGQLRWVGIRAEREGSNGHARVIATLHDRQHIREQQAEYQRLHQQMTALIEGSIDCIFVKDTEGRYLVVNRALCELTNKDPEQIIGLRDDDLFPADLAEKYSQDDERFMHANSAATYEEEVQTPHGRKLFLTTKGPLMVDGQVRGVFGISREITALKEAEENVRLLNIHLENRVAQRTAELEQVNQELRTFSYSVSHDLKAPLRAIQGYSQLLLEDHAPALNPEARSFLHTISQSSQHMAELIDHLLEYSRADRQALHSEDVALQALVEQILGEHQARIGALGAHIDLTLHGIVLHSDARCLRQIFSNLIDNALKFRQSDVPPELHISARQDSQFCTLRVQDNGIGFDMKLHGRIFDIFQRLHSQAEYPGTGIGLAIVRKAAQRLGAHVWAESKPGLGSTFFVRIPLDESAHAPHSAD